MRRLARILTLTMLIGGLLVLMASAAFAQDGDTANPAVTFAEVAVTIGAAALIVEKIVERLRVAFVFLHGTAVNVLAVGLGFAAAYGFDLTMGAAASEFIDKLFAALIVGLGAGKVNDVTD